MHYTNPSTATGDGLGAAYRAKVRMDHLAYVQFHPTALRNKVNENVFLITEAVRGAGGILLNSKKERFMLQIDGRAELASRTLLHVVYTNRYKSKRKIMFGLMVQRYQ